MLQIRSMALNLDSTRAQIEQISAQLAFQKDTLAKTGLLLAQGAATKQNNDDLKTQVTILQAKLEEANSRYAMIRNEREQLLSALSFLDLQIKDTIIRAPQDGTILNKYYEQGEVIQPGMVLVDLADLRSLDARIYLPLSRIPSIKIGQEVRIKTDGIKESLKGKITWIASEAEFTPKTILTKETRTTLVYAVKVTVENPDGKLKMGMPVEVDNLTQR
ncbi:MAG: HlyD family efflux transporter periplasmic adaptor subunit [Candidatus Margulisbacteria bacterium]|nr:HlyD family efflux transporter periplasmic adaptor subunit [Candidatus Margulisiibacteriota bacterium]